MPATKKSDLLDVTARDYAKLRTLISDIDAAAAMRKRDEDTSIKDVIAHRAHWIDLFLGWYADGQAGKDVQFPAPGYKWTELKRYNADLRVRQAHMDWPEAVAMLDARHALLVDLIESCNDPELYGGPMKGAKNDWTVGRWAEASGPSHYRSALKYIRKELKADTAASTA